MEVPGEHQTSAATNGDAVDERELDSAAGIGPRVSAVFTAAEQAAEHILTMARAEVVDMRREAEAEVAAMRAAQRQEAGREAQQILDDARAEADRIRAEAREHARGTEETARRREAWINEGIRLAIERAEWGRRGLEEVISRLGDFVVRPPTEWPDLPREPVRELGPAAPTIEPSGDGERADAGT
ncbi:MAG TPA: hypothetical protein VHF67_14010 [Gaiellaceae bacterium]|nr:hypothetical protein [Gaiellaceae bacterium]